MFKKNNKKAFTLIEIIICIGLLSIVATATIYGIVRINNKKEMKTLENYSEKLESALEVYLSNHSEVLHNINNNFEGGVVSLELLKNEGLIKDDLDVDYKENYFLLSNAVFKDSDDECEGQVSIQTIKSWNLDKYDTSKILYICPRNSSGGSNGGAGGTLLTQDIKSYLQGPDGLYIAKGWNPNNWVEFPIDYDFELTIDDAGPSGSNVVSQSFVDWVCNGYKTDDPEKYRCSRTDDTYTNITKRAFTYFPKHSEYGNLWRIMSITSNGEIYLVYNSSVEGNNKIISSNWNTNFATFVNSSLYNGWYEDPYKSLNTQDLYSYNGSAKNGVYNYVTDDGWTYSEIMDDAHKTSINYWYRKINSTRGGNADSSYGGAISKKEMLYALIKNKSWLSDFNTGSGTNYFGYVTSNDVENSKFTFDREGTSTYLKAYDSTLNEEYSFTYCGQQNAEQYGVYWDGNNLVNIRSGKYKVGSYMHCFDNWDGIEISYQTYSYTPVIKIKSDIYIKSGSGTVSDPYKLGE